MVRDLMTNCRHRFLFLVVQKILASLKLTTVFTVTTECISKNGFEKKFQLQPGIIIIAYSQNQTSFFSEGNETVSFYLIWPRHHEKVSHKVDETERRWAKCAPSEGRRASGAPLRALSSDFVVLSSASERPETELFQCRCSLGVSVTKYSSVKTKRGKLSVEMTDQPFVTK